MSSASAFGAPRSGSYALNLCSAGNTYTATAQLTGLVSGSSYRVSFYASRRNLTASGDSFSASVNTSGAPTAKNVAFAELPAVGSGNTDVNYALQTLDFTATATTHTLSVAANSYYGFMLDDFSISEIVIPPTPPGTLADYNEVWTTPSTASWESMPLGNGETTLNVWVEGNGDLLFYIGRSDSESENNRNLKLGRVRVKLTPNPFVAGQPFSQTLDLATGRILINAGPTGAQTRLKVWVDANHPVIRVTGDSDSPVSVEASYEMNLRTLNTATTINDAHQGDYVLNDGANAVTWYRRNRGSAFYSNLSAEGLTQSLATIQDPLMNRTVRRTHQRHRHDTQRHAKTRQVRHDLARPQHRRPCRRLSGRRKLEERSRRPRHRACRPATPPPTSPPTRPGGPRSGTAATCTSADPPVRPGRFRSTTPTRDSSTPAP